MKAFLITVLKFSTSFFVLISTLIFLCNLNLRSNITFNAMEKTSFSTLILGDSQTEADINDSIISNSLNLSNSGDPIFFNYIKLKYLLDHDIVPETLILGFSPNNLHSKGFYEVPKMKNKLKNYLPLIDSQDLKEILTHNFEGGIRGLVSSLFYSLRKDAFWSNTSIHKIGIGSHRKLPMFNNGKLSIDIADKKTYSNQIPDDISTKYLDRIITLCENYDIQLILLNTPIHSSLRVKERIRRESYMRFIDGVNKNVIVWDYNNYELEDKLFYDENHLNEEGAIKFSSFIQSKLKNLND